MNKEVIKLIEKFDEFSTATGSTDLLDFSVWLNRSAGSKEEPGKPESEVQTGRDIAYLINRLARFSKFQTRKVLADFNMTSIDEFYFLLSIGRLGSPSKNEVYKDTITELTTGAQIMRRIISNGFVSEIPDVQDKRVKRVRLTEKGEKIKNKIFLEFSQSVVLKTGNLSREEKENFLNILKKLDEFHSLIYENDPDKPINVLIEKYIMP